MTCDLQYLSVIYFIFPVQAVIYNIFYIYIYLYNSTINFISSQLIYVFPKFSFLSQDLPQVQIVLSEDDVYLK